MRVAVVAPEFPPEIGGMQTYAYQFVLELARRGHRVTVFTRPHPEGEVSLTGIEVLPVLRLRADLDRNLAAGPQPDVWHVMNAAYAWLALETAPVVVSVHGNDFLRPYLPLARPRLERIPGLWRLGHCRDALEDGIGQLMMRRVIRRGLPRAAHIFANSRYTEAVFLQKYPSCRGRTSAAMVGVAREYFAGALTGPYNGQARLITVCRLAEPRKNVDVVLRALSTLKDRYAFSYTVVGDGALRIDLERLAGKLGLEGRVRFTGFVDDNELRMLLGASDLFVLPSSIRQGSHEGFGIAYLEANACGTPVLAARLAGAVEAVEEGRSGFFVDTPDVPAVAQALDRFLARDVTFDRSVCRSFAERFTWQKVVDHALDHYPAPAMLARL